MPDISQMAEQAVELATKAGAQDVWSEVSQSREVRFSYRDGNLEKVKDATSRSMVTRIYVDGRYASYRTNDLKTDRLTAFIKEAIAITRALEPDQFRRITPAELFRNRPGDALDLVDAGIKRLTREQRMDWCRALFNCAEGEPNLISATSYFSDRSSISAAASSNGFTGKAARTNFYAGLSATLKDQGDKRAQGGNAASGLHLESLPSARFIGDLAMQRTRLRLGTEKGPSVKTTMVVDARVARSLISRLLGPANARSIQQGRSFWSSLKGRKTFSDTLTITDNPLLKRGFGSRHYDDEGISAKVLPIIDEGIVRNFYVDTYYGRKADMPPTTGRASNRIVTPGDKSLEELMQQAGSGVYITSWIGGNSDATTGDFSLGLLGHMIENGKVGRPVGEMNVTGNLVDLFNQLEILGNDPFPYSATLAPSLVFSDVSFSGA